MTDKSTSAVSSTQKKLLVLGFVVVLIAIFFTFGGHEVLDLDFFKSQWEMIAGYYQRNPLLTGLIFFTVYVLVTGLSLPGAAILTLIAGAMFGFVAGTILVSFASTLGATVAFLIARFILREAILSKFKEQMQVIEEGVARDGAFYLFALRLVPAIPFFVVNLVMSITPIRVFTFIWVSQIGMLAGTMVYVYAGSQVSQINELSLAGILKPELIVSFVLLGLFPLVAKFVINKFNLHRNSA